LKLNGKNGFTILPGFERKRESVIKQDLLTQGKAYSLPIGLGAVKWREHLLVILHRQTDTGIHDPQLHSIQFHTDLASVLYRLNGIFNHIDQYLFQLFLVERNHYRIIRQFWGRANEPDKQAEAYAGLGKLYVSDERYTMVERKPQPEFADFMCKAMAYFAKKELS